MGAHKEKKSTFHGFSVLIKLRIYSEIINRDLDLSSIRSLIEVAECNPLNGLSFLANVHWNVDWT
jgi:hypothetical protein